MRAGTQKRPKAAGTTTTAPPRATLSPGGMTNGGLGVREAGTTAKAMPSSATMSPAGMTMAPMWDRVAGAMMKRPR